MSGSWIIRPAIFSPNAKLIHHGNQIRRWKKSAKWQSEKHSKLERVAVHFSSEINIYLRTLMPFLSFDLSRSAPHRYRRVLPDVCAANVRHIQMSDCSYRIKKNPFQSKCQSGQSWNLSASSINRSSVSSSHDHGATNAWLGNVEVLLLTLPVGPKHTRTTQNPLLTLLF